MSEKIIPFPSESNKGFEYPEGDACDLCNRGFTKKRFTMNVTSEEGDKRMVVCEPCADLARLPREVRVKLWEESNEKETVKEVAEEQRKKLDKR